ncbi:hypothetical protein PL321_13215 [Caloramator sp. mosi_1]|uniref:hypothetical protein n=1 Tax=Caloramator sp. mosi_1 TaxID=3023090 RepID=UPI00235E6FC0|nr:hypothetical protein [Caloramator sp. mosi_1]WDC83603.1 hypothetical protein PL321_13215 [Caloramator sp. mosi_1]
MPKLTTLIGLEISKMFHKKRILFGLSFLVFIYFMMVIGLSKVSIYQNTNDPKYKAMLEDELRHNKERLNSSDISNEEKEAITRRIEDINLELELGYEKAREIQLKRELEEVNKLLSKEDLPPDVRESQNLYKQIIEAKIKYGENSIEARKLEYKLKLNSIETSLKNKNLTPVEKKQLESQKGKCNLDLSNPI